MNTGFGAKKSFRLAPMFEEIDKYYARVDDEKNKLVKKYGEIDEVTGNPTIAPSNTQAMRTFNDEMEQLCREEVTIKEVVIYDDEIPDTTDQASILTPNDLINLKGFVKERPVATKEKTKK